MKNHKIYMRSLLQTSLGRSFYEAGQKLSEFYISSPDRTEQFISQSVADVIGPTLVSYCLWVLRKAQELNIHNLYFLARDGKILMEICEILKEKYNLNINCKYLYVSRYSLRKALFSIDSDESIRYICRNSISMTPALIMQRSGLNMAEQQQILLELGYKSKIEQDTVLAQKELEVLYFKLKKSDLFCSSMQKMSDAYNSTIFQYFQQQGLAEEPLIAIVDSGWTGSIQRCIRQILTYNNILTPISGFYFGLQAAPRKEDGVYNWFYFGPKDHYEYIHFNNNLFECWCMADHGMTLGYTKDDQDKVFPILNKYIPQWHGAAQAEMLKKYALLFTSQRTSFESIPLSQLPTLIRPLLIRFMTHPTPMEAKIYGSIPFCDDTTEAYLHPLAAPLSALDLCKNLTLVKVFCKILNPLFQITIRESGWREGTIANLPFPANLLMYTDSQLSYFVKILAYKFSFLWRSPI